uniref:Secreted protein n=1 Tax=Achlya hypogyna TaxID=1202772 RepID=A0A0A7CP31_ACHHY|nr:secreted protein [Achlya hypogyna]
MRFLVPLLATISASALGYTSATCSTIQKGMDYAGNDIKNVAVSGTEQQQVDACCKACANQISCVGWAINSGKCWLKNKMILSGANSIVIAGYYEQPTISSGKCGSLVQDVDYSGNDIKNFAVTGSPQDQTDQCCSACSTTSGCVGFVTHDNTCWLKNKMTKSGALVGTIAGTYSALSVTSGTCGNLGYDYNYAGNDITSLAVSGTRQSQTDQCCSACSTTLGCVGFVVYDSKCWLKNAMVKSAALTAPTTLAPTVAPTTLAPTVAPTTLAPTTLAPTVAPTTLAPTVAPTTLAPTTLEPTVAPTTLAPTVAPTTLAPTTLAPTVAPTTLAPTESPTTVLPTTEAPTTEAPTTEAPTTEAPTTESPTTESPTTESPTTEAPTTESPTTESPTTESPTTESPTTESPTTEAPTTESPTTEAPTTESPTTESPTTEAPTESPTTEVPTTETPTEAPTTEAPTEFPSTEAPITSGTCSSLTRGVDYPGNDIAHFAVSGSEQVQADQCCASCSTTPGCVGFVVHDSTCWLKESLGASVELNGAITGAYTLVKPTSGTCSPVTLGFDYPGNDIKSFSVNGTLQDETNACCEACSKTVGCVGFVTHTNTCWLKNSMTNFTRVKGIVVAGQFAHDGAGRGACYI